MIVTSRNSKVDCLYCTVHFTKQKIGISNVLILIRMLIILFFVAKEMFCYFFPLSFKDLLSDVKICDLTLSKQVALIKKHHQVAKKFPLLFNLLQTTQVKWRSSMFNRKSRKKFLNPLNTAIIFHQK